jgi:hypothetical protein
LSDYCSQRSSIDLHSIIYEDPSQKKKKNLDSVSNCSALIFCIELNWVHKRKRKKKKIREEEEEEEGRRRRRRRRKRGYKCK